MRSNNYKNKMNNLNSRLNYFKIKNKQYNKITFKYWTYKNNYNNLKFIKYIN
jgi:hypothetical protein